MTQEILSLIANLAAVVRIQNGNLYADTNALLAHADRMLSANPKSTIELHKYFTAVYLIPKDRAPEFVTDVCASEFWSAGSWSHALNERDAARDALKQLNASTGAQPC